jgi:hypothetical protein
MQPLGSAVDLRCLLGGGRYRIAIAAPNRAARPMVVRVHVARSRPSDRRAGTPIGRESDRDSEDENRYEDSNLFRGKREICAFGCCHSPSSGLAFSVLLLY